jgi:hypothetical protein
VLEEAEIRPASATELLPMGTHSTVPAGEAERKPYVHEEYEHFEEEGGSVVVEAGERAGHIRLAEVAAAAQTLVVGDRYS